MIRKNSYSYSSSGNLDKKAELKLIDKYRKKVHSQYPKAFLSSVGGKYTIVQEKDDFDIVDVLAELCICAQDTPLKAWEMAQVTAKTTQNFNRTHPLRLEGMDAAEKMARIEERKAKNYKEKPNKNTKILDSYYIYD